MVRKCMYPHCKNSQRHNPKNIRFHSCPQQYVKEWIEACGLTCDVAPSRIFVCCEHFAGGNGPTREHPLPVAFQDVTEAAAPSRKSLKRFIAGHITPRKPAAALALLKLSEHFSPGATTVDNGFDDPTWIDMDIAEEIGHMDSDSTIVFPSPIRSVKRVYQRGTPQKKRATYETKIYPWELKFQSPMSKRIRLASNSSTLEDLGCDVLSAMEENEETLHKGSTVKHGSLVSHNFVANTANICPSIPLFDSNSHKVTSKPEYRSIGTQCNMPSISYDRCKMMSSKKFHFFTGLTQTNFEILYETLGDDAVCEHLKYKYGNTTPKKLLTKFLTPKDKLFMTLLRLRRGIPVEDLGFVFHVTAPTVSKIFYTWIRLISLTFQRLRDAMFVSAKAQKDKPKCFQPFKNLRGVMDCFEIRIQRPFNYEQQGNTHSQYKGANTGKVLLVISCFGSISFVSEVFEGSISDRQMVLQSGFLDFLQPNDAIMADRGFNVEADLNDLEVELLIPPFMGQRKKLTARECILTRAIAGSRIHVERAIGKVRNFRLLR